MRDAERLETIIIGGGQAGLSVGYHLALRGVRFAILEGNERIGDSWRNRWDSLRLFTPAFLDALPGMRFPAPAGAFPTKDEMASYLESYAARHALPIRTGVRVDRLSRRDGRYVAAAGDRVFVNRASTYSSRAASRWPRRSWRQTRSMNTDWSFAPSSWGADAHFSAALSDLRGEASVLSGERHRSG